VEIYCTCTLRYMTLLCSRTVKATKLFISFLTKSGHENSTCPTVLTSGFWCSTLVEMLSVVHFSYFYHTLRSAGLVEMLRSFMPCKPNTNSALPCLTESYFSQPINRLKLASLIYRLQTYTHCKHFFIRQYMYCASQYEFASIKFCFGLK